MKEQLSDVKEARPSYLTPGCGFSWVMLSLSDNKGLFFFFFFSVEGVFARRMCSNVGRGKNLGGRTHNTLAPRCRGGTSRVGVQPKACTLEYSQGLPGPVPLLSLPFKAAPGKNKPYDSGNPRVTPDLVHPGFSTADSTAGALTAPWTLPVLQVLQRKFGLACIG